MSIRFTQTHFVNMNQVTAGAWQYDSRRGRSQHLNRISTPASCSAPRQQQAATAAGQIPRSQPTNLGTLNQWYFEDDQLIAGSTDCDKGWRFAVRFNTFESGDQERFSGC